ncbi:sigma-54-dependent Fis family transcriptional regulator, partial [candidate division WOR-3 bacterium]|nr:sigma-54-dependent Fis family transcriptional regulator [candidate division WOR-3 bacterium]
MKNKLLIIDDDEELLKLLKKGLKDEFLVATATNADDGLNQFKVVDFNVGLLDVVLPDKNGIEVLNEMKNLDSDFPIVVMTGHASIDLAVRAMKLGAFYFVEKPFSPKAIKEILKRAIEQSTLLKDYQSLRKVAEEKYSFSGILGRSGEMQDVFELIERVASAEATVLIEGESGTGKELVAKAIHFNSPRKENRFVA